MDKRRTAIHEAGHAVMCMHLKAPIVFVEIRETEDGGWAGKNRCLTIRNHHQDNIHLLLGGICAEHLFYGDGDYWRGNTDMEQAHALAEKWIIKGDIDKHMEEQIKLTKRVISKNKHYVEFIARELEQKGRLSGSELKSAVEAQEKKWEKQTAPERIH